MATPHCFAFSIIVGLCLLVASIWWWRATIVKLRQVEAKLQEEEKLSEEKSLTSHAEEDRNRAEAGKINKETQRRQKESRSFQLFVRVEGKTRVLHDIESGHTVKAIKE